MVTTVVHTIKPGGGGQFSSLTAWATGTLFVGDPGYPGNIRRDLVSLDQIEVAEVYSGGNAGSVTQGGWTADTTRYPWIRAAVGHDHGGSFNVNKAYSINSGSSAQAYTRVGPGLSIDTGNGYMCFYVSPTTIEGCIIKGGEGVYGCILFYTTVSNVGTSMIKNCIVFSPYNCIRVEYTAIDVKIYNCILMGGTVSISRGSGTVTSQNNYLGGGYLGTITKGVNDITSDNSATTASLRNAPYADSTTTQVWAEAGYNALPSNTSYHTSVVHDGKMWAIGGYPGRKTTYSTNGSSWTEVGSALGINYHTSIAYNSKMWNMGGTLGRKVYSSTNGITWTEAGTDALPVATNYPLSVVYDNKIWIIGGSGEPRKVRYSTDGITWAEAGTDVLPTNTYSGWGGVVVHNSKMWLIGGSSGSRAVYSSTDGIVWTLVSATALPIATMSTSFNCVVHDSKIWAINGRNVYYSTDGVTWTQKNVNSAPSVLSLGAAIAFDNKIWVIGGSNSLKAVYSFPNTPTFAPFQSVTDGSENLRSVVSMSNKLLDSGANLTSESVTTDIIGTVRPQNGAFDIGAFENDIPLCWNYTAQYKNSSKLFKASGCGSFPKSLRVPNNIDTNTGKMIDDGDLIDPKRYSIE